MWLTLLAVAILAAFVVLGAWRGALATGLGIASLVGAYAAALFLGPALAPALGERLGLGPLLALPIAASGVFFVSYVLLGLAASLVQRMARSENAGRSPLDRFLGGSFGALRGLLIAGLLVYLAMWLDALRTTGTAAVIPEVGDSAAAAVTGEVVQSALESALGADDPAARVTARLAARPAVAAAELQGVIEAPAFERLRSDASFWTYVESGNVDAAMNRASFQAFQHDASLRHRLANLALVPDEAASDPAAFRRAIGEVLREVGPRLRGLRNDPALQELMRDPQVVAMLQSGDTLGLLGHPGFRDLVQRVTSSTSQE